MKISRLKSDRRLIVIISAMVVIVAAAVLFLRSPSKAPALNAARLASDPTLGPPSAKVILIEYGDFGCPTCRGWEQAGVLKQIVAVYGDQVHFVWRDYPVITAQSPQAADAGQCAFDQNKFWQYHDLLYAKAPALSINDLKSYAAQLDLNTTQFNDCLELETGSSQSRSKHGGGARSYGFIGTPSFIINGKKVIGPASFSQFKSVIDPILVGG